MMTVLLVMHDTTLNPMSSQVVLVVRVEVPDATLPWNKENKDLVDRILRDFPGTVDYSTSVAYSPSHLVGLFHCSDVLIHAPTQEVRARVLWSVCALVDAVVRSLSTLIIHVELM